MADQFYGNGTSYAVPGQYTSHSAGANPYLSSSSLMSAPWHLSSDAPSTGDPARYPALERYSSSLYLNPSGGPRLPETGGAVLGSGFGEAGSTPSLYTQCGAPLDPALLSGAKRPSEALYHQTILGNHHSIGQSEALFSTNSLVKRPRIDIASHMPIYPQLPGERDCPHYLWTRTCEFEGKFNNPLGVPEGGIPDCKEIPLVNPPEYLPERPGEPDCPYQKCMFGPRCKFNHPKNKVPESTAISRLPERPPEPVPLITPPESLPERPGVPDCPYQRCTFGLRCKFNHPKNKVSESTVISMLPGIPSESVPLISPIESLPERPGEPDCPYQNCMFGLRCKFNHRKSKVSELTVIPRLPEIPSKQVGVSTIVFPQRPGQMECDFYMRTGDCSFGERCKFHHPIDRSVPTPPIVKEAVQQGVIIPALAALPRREGSIFCPPYMETGSCTLGANCKYDHPPPVEFLKTMVPGSVGSGTVAGGEEAKKKVNAKKKNASKHSAKAKKKGNAKEDAVNRSAKKAGIKHGTKGKKAAKANG